MKQGWEIKKLGDVCDDLFAGGDVPKDRLSKTKTSSFSVPIFSNGEKNKGLYGYTDVARVKKPSITISARGTIGYSEIREEAFYPAVRLIVVVPNTNIVSLSFLKLVISSIDFTHSGSSIPQLTVPMIREYPIVLPSLKEQQHIVSILDEAFANISKTKDNAEQNLKNAKELFESYLQDIYSNTKKTYENKTLKELFDFKNGRSFKKTEWKETGVPIIRIQNLNNSEADFNYFQGKYDMAIEVNKEDLLFSWSGTVGTSFGSHIWKQNKGVLNQHIFKVNIKTDLDKYFAYYALKYITKEVEKQVNGAAGLVHITKDKLNKFEVVLPPLKEQQTIVKKLDELSFGVKRLEAIYEQKLNDLEELKKSILQKAFNGEL